MSTGRPGNRQLSFVKSSSLPPPFSPAPLSPTQRTGEWAQHRLNKVVWFARVRLRPGMVALVLCLVATLLLIVAAQGLNIRTEIVFQPSTGQASSGLLRRMYEPTPGSSVGDVYSLREQHGTVPSNSQFLVIRPISNEYPGYHHKGYAVAWLKHVLQNEAKGPEGSVRVWFLDRLVWAEQEEEIINLLRAHNEIYFRVQFNHEEFASLELDFFALQRLGLPAGYLTSIDFRDLEDGSRVAVLSAVYRNKAAYMFRKNTLRNLLLELGVGWGAEWILPLDPGTVLTSRFWKEVQDSVVGAAGRKEYVLQLPVANVAFKELGPNMEGAVANREPMSTNPPMLMFHRDSTTRYDPDTKGACVRQDAELPIRLGLSGRWASIPTQDQTKDTSANETQPLNPPTNSAVPVGAVVARVMESWHAEQGMTGGDLCVRKMMGMQALLEGADTVAHVMRRGLGNQTTLAWNSAVLDREKEAWRLESAPGAQKTALSSLVGDVLRCADSAMQQAPFSVTHKPKSGGAYKIMQDNHNYFSVKPYWWPDPKSPTGYSRRDGERRPDSHLYAKGSENYDRSRLQSLYGNTTCLALAYHFTEDKKYAEKAAEFVRTWFLNSDTRMNPTIRYAQWKPGAVASHSAIIEFFPFFYLLDAIRIVYRSGSLSDSEYVRLQRWCRDLAFNMHRTHQVEAYYHYNNVGVFSSMLVLSLAAFAGDQDSVVNGLQLERGRMLGTIDADGTLPYEFDREDSTHYTLYTMQAWFNLVSLGLNAGINMWPTREPGRLVPLLCRAAMRNIRRFNASALLPTQDDGRPVVAMEFLARAHCAGLEDLHPDPPGSIYAAEHFLEQSKYGVQPFWNLGRNPPSVPPIADADRRDLQHLWNAEAKMSVPHIVAKNQFSQDDDSLALTRQLARERQQTCTLGAFCNSPAMQGLMLGMVCAAVFLAVGYMCGLSLGTRRNLQKPLHRMLSVSERPMQRMGGFDGGLTSCKSMI